MQETLAFLLTIGLVRWIRLTNNWSPCALDPQLIASEIQTFSVYPNNSDPNLPLRFIFTENGRTFQKVELCHTQNPVSNNI